VSFDLDAAQMRQLLDELDQRLSVAGIAATVYVVEARRSRYTSRSGARAGEGIRTLNPLFSRSRDRRSHNVVTCGNVPIRG
jgi:hypothetical protein